MYFFIFIIIQKRRNMQKPGLASPATSTTVDLDLSIVPRGSTIIIIINYSALSGSTAY